MANDRRVNLVDIVLGLIFLSLLAALAVQILVPNPLRQAVLDEADRPYVAVVVESDALFLGEKMTPGDRQLGEHDRVEAELQSVERTGDRLRSVWKVRARDWRGTLQFGGFDLKPGERLEIHAPEYKLIGWIVEVRP
ncbi:MAG: hypothetical protein ACYTAF_11945 [Planctomycetota bacterium]|jgi:hypothetical protein